MRILALADATTVAEQTTDTVAKTFNNSWDAVRESFANAWHNTIEWAPQVVAMVAVIVIGYVVARLVGKMATTLAEKLGLQSAAEQSGLADSMQRVGIQRNVSAIVGTIVFWLLMLVFLMAGFNILGAETLTKPMESIVAYIPKLLLATVVVVVGLLVATFLRGVVATSADRVGLSYAEHLANGCYYAFALLTFIAAFNQVGVQIGGELRSQYETWSWGVLGKAGAYVNFSEVHRQVSVATLPFYDVSPTLQDAAFLGELSFFAAYNISPNWTLRSSLDMVLLAGAAQAPYNIDYLFSSRPEVFNSGTVQLLGMSFGMEVVW